MQFKRVLVKKVFRSSMLFSFTGIIFFLIVIISENDHRHSLPDERINFKGFDNQTGTDHFIVPNIIHLIRMNQTQFTFTDWLCLQAAYHNHRPDYFYIHTDAPNGQFTGKYWSLIEKDLELRSRIIILPIEAPFEIFGQQLSPKWRLHHGGDISRIRTMMKYGGIYIDNDVYVIKNLDQYRKFEIAMNWDEEQSLASQVIIAHKDARFLQLWLDSYHEYHPELWYYNAGERPTKEVLMKQPEVVNKNTGFFFSNLIDRPLEPFLKLHRVKVQFGADLWLSYYLYTKLDFDWRALDCIHLMINHRHYFDPYYNETPYFDEKIVQKYKFPFGQMAREIIDISAIDVING